MIQIYLAYGLILIGCVLIVSGAIACLRFPDFFCRLHGASIADSGGMVLVMLGLVIYNGLTIMSAKILLLLLVLLITAPVTCNALAKAAICGGLVPKAKLSEFHDNE